MKSSKITVTNPSGLHLRPASLFANLANKCNSKVTVLYNDKRINAKSVLNIITAGIKKGSEIVVECEGETEEEDLETLLMAITSGLGE